MKNKHIIFGLIGIIGLLSSLPYTTHAYSLRQFSNKEGLSNSAILSLYQDNQGVIWIGSCDGLNIYDGSSIRTYNPPNASKTCLSGNLINGFLSTGEDALWIQTNYGLDRLDMKKQTCQNFVEFRDNTFMAKSKDNEVFILKDDGLFYYYQQEKGTFQPLNTPQQAFEHILSTAIDANNIVWVFTSDNDNRSYQIHKSNEGVSLIPRHLFKHPERLRWAFPDGQLVYFIDESYSLYEYDFNNQQPYFIADLKAEIEKRGEVSSIIKQQNDYYIGFKNSGLIILKYMSDQKVKYQIQPTDIHSGVFCLMKDKFQDIVWIGTDGQGVYMYFKDAFSITNVLLDTPVYQINNPVRAVYYDNEQTLWIGSKGGGILRLNEYSIENGTSTSFNHLSTSNSTLTDNAVYCFAPGSMNRLWIGTENGINYYSYKNKQLNSFTVTADGKKVKYVHSIHQLNDTTLWVSTVGEGIVKVILNKDDSSLIVKSATRIVLDGGRLASNYFFTSFQESDSILWFGNRGYGAHRLNIETGQFTPYSFDHIVNSQTANDIFAIYRNKQGYWFGTSSGLLHFNPEDLHNPTRIGQLSSNTVHGILEDQQNNIWVSTNQGLVRFNPNTHTGQTYDRKNELEVTEFSDGAFYKHTPSGTLFFGGTNGFVAIKPNAYNITDYMPQISIEGLFIFGKERNISDFRYEKQGKTVLRLDYSQNFFHIDFRAIDYINGNNYSYYYKLDEASDQWIESGTSASAVFSNLSPGQYTLSVKYKNNINGKECQPQSFLIQIIPPWYASSGAYIIYFILLSLCCVSAVYLLIRQYRRKQHRIIEKMNREKKEEIYESKLRFFTNITHEFCTPLTLIYGPCEKILAHAQADSYIQKYGKMIQQNAEKLNALILELLEFRRLETGNKILSVQRFPVSDKLRDIAASFEELAESKGLDYKLNIEPDIDWNTDASCFNKIANNLISNAFKYTPESGHITVALNIENRQLVFRVSNSGKGIAKENLDKIFDRYKILDSVELNGKNSRNGLGLAICKSMVTVLNGQIEIESIPDEITTFTVTLPELSPSEQLKPQEVYQTGHLKVATEAIKLEKTTTDFDPSKQTVMIIDDDPSMLWFISEVFTDTYNVLSFSSATDALSSLDLRQPDLIISDVMMPEIDGLSFTRRVKQNKLWSHIPLILLSALHHEDDQVRGLDSGADAYLTKPFNVKYLEKIVYRLIKRKHELKEYYNSAFSAFQLENGNLIHQEDQDFLNKVMEIIDKNIENPALSVDLLSSELGYSTRQFYRKLKPITAKSPADMIRDYRLTVAERLLLTKNLTIEEVIDKTGFANRGTFYKLFSLRFGMPPRQYREQQKESVVKGNK